MTQLVLPVDTPDLAQVRELISRTRGLVDWYKFGSIPFTALGPRLVEMGHEAGARVFLDMKYHDIPNTVAGAAEACVELGVEMFNVHVSGGREMLLKAVERMKSAAARKNVAPPIAMGVTVLTSLDDAAWSALLGIAASPVSRQVVHFAKIARESGLDGVVASPLEIKAIKESCGAEFLVLTPGIRMPDAPVKGDDQARTLTPAQAARLGADFIVVGRPITQAKDPAAVCLRIREEIAGVGGTK